MSENYIMLNGKRVDLTDEQLEKLGLKVKQDCFERRSVKEKYFFIDTFGTVSYDYNDSPVGTDRTRHKVANYCTDEKLMQKRALHETLSRLLWRFSMQNDGDKIDWSDSSTSKYRIAYDHTLNKICNILNYDIQTNCVYFYSAEIANRAIDEIILPFMKEHPEFVW